MFLSEDDFWAPFFNLIQHTVEANLTTASFVESVVDTSPIEDCFAALESHVQA
ncbi:MAG: hypothetical protein H7124_00270 [Phycisphaerales bacterium]|nr:hypothetical protein [Hyphomonadaceae bacterium]